MKRDLNLIRDLLHVIEQADHPGVVNRHGLNPYEPKVQYHLRLLSEAGFVRGVGHTADGAVSVRLTWAGHEFLEMARNDVVWERAKRYVIERTSGLSAAALQATLAAWSQSAATEAETWRFLDRHPLDVARDARHAAAKNAGNGNGSSLRARESDDWRPPVRLAPYYWWENPTPVDSHFQLQVTNTGPVDATPVYGF